ncbi:MAG: hypothetical protein U0R18_11305 [Mycobacterium sp.]
MTDDWTTTAGLKEIARTRGERIDGWRAPVAFAVGHLVDGSWVFPHVNKPGGSHGLSAVLLAEALGYSSGTAEFMMTDDQLADAIARLAPAEETPGIRHANLEAWRKLVGAPGTKVAAFIADLDDPPAGAADVALRALL